MGVGKWGNGGLEMVWKWGTATNGAKLRAQVRWAFISLASAGSSLHPVSTGVELELFSGLSALQRGFSICSRPRHLLKRLEKRR